jgi:hypothetical protein|nr:MAG TPA: Protein of unknown function (DUF1351) [Caudoviricetes sp.]
MQEEINVNEIVKIESMAVIKQQLDKVDEFIKEKTKNIPSVLNELKTLSKEEKEEKKGEIKKYKQYLSNIRNELENKRKEIKKEINKPYEEFNEYYSNGVLVELTQGIAQLENVISDIEIAQKQEKYNELKEFYDEYTVKYNLENMSIPFERVGLNITLNASIKSLKEQIVSFCEKVANDLKLIEIEEFKDEIMLEFRNTLDFANSKIQVIERHKQLELIKQRDEELAKKKEEESKIVEKVEEVTDPVIIAPKEVNIPIEKINEYEVTFTVKGTNEQIAKLIQFLNEEGLRYE